jgi:hypothetical protein
MPSEQLVLSETPSTVFPGVPVGRVKVTILANPATVSATGDGSWPQMPITGSVEPTTTVIAGVLGQVGWVVPPTPAGHLNGNPQINLASNGNPTVLVSW